MFGVLSFQLDGYLLLSFLVDATIHHAKSAAGYPGFEDIW